MSKKLEWVGPHINLRGRHPRVWRGPLQERYSKVQLLFPIVWKE